MHNASILVVDDDNDILLAVRLLLKRHYSNVVTLSDPKAIPEQLKIQQFDIYLLDMNFTIGVNTGDEGIYWLKHILQFHNDAAIILMTAYGDIETSVKAIKQGAADFVLKPWQNEKLLATLNSALLLSASRKHVRHLEQQNSELLNKTKASAPTAASASMHQLLRLTERAAKTNANVLILGENGSGKDVIAQYLYRNSMRANQIMLTVDLGAVSENLFESELFGHVKGAFTDARSDRPGCFQAASGGTLFLDEIGNLPLHLQAKLLRVIESGEISPVGSDQVIKVDVRLITATNMPLEALTDESRFRRDLYYRINTIQLDVPPLRERREDIPLLTHHFIEGYSRKYNLAKKSIRPDTVNALLKYEWPGNVRELAHAVERALILSDNENIEEDDFFLHQSSSLRGPELTIYNLDELEKETITQALAKHNGNVSHSANALGITRASLYRRMKKFKL